MSANIPRGGAPPFSAIRLSSFFKRVSAAIKLGFKFNVWYYGWVHCKKPKINTKNGGIWAVTRFNVNLLFPTETTFSSDW